MRMDEFDPNRKKINIDWRKLSREILITVSGVLS